ncbi:MAG: YibE/F family protein [Candidatus Saccharimonadales bacterium]
MNKRWLAGILGIVLLVVIVFNIIPTSIARENVSYYKAQVINVNTEDNSRTIYLLGGPDKGKEVSANIGAKISSLDMTPPDYHTGSVVFVSHNLTETGTDNYSIIDYYRLSAGAWMFLFVIALAVIFAGWRGFGALAGLIFSIIVIGKFLIPGVANGNSPYLIAGVSIMIISLPGIYIAHGINRKTSVALISTYITLLVAIGFSITATSLLKLSGVANEDAWLLSQLKPEINMHGVLLCGLLISLVGILDDVTVGQASVIQELSIANSKLNTKELYKRGLRVGREHIASLINTLVLVYVGASLLFIMYLTVVVPYPTIMVLNSELMMEEIVRSLVGSASLILAVPITSVLAAKYLRKRR